MVKYAFITFIGLAAALPLNINLGAYSPALVVGDGEISFGGRQDVSNLINALEGAAVNAAAGAANAATAGAGNAAAAVTGPDTATASTITLPNNVEAAASADPALTEQAQQIAGLQGLGKSIAPRDDDCDDAVESEKLGKRDLAGFDRALTFAEAALTKGPKIQLGTGAEGSGVGIIVDHAPAGAEAEGAAAAKRDLDDTNIRRRAKVTTMYVRRGVPASLQGSSEGAAAAEAVAVRAPPPPATVSRRDAIDEVNLNVDGDAGVTMTFVESFDDEDDE